MSDIKSVIQAPDVAELLPLYPELRGLVNHLSTPKAKRPPFYAIYSAEILPGDDPKGLPVIPKDSRHLEAIERVLGANNGRVNLFYIDDEV